MDIIEIFHGYLYSIKYEDESEDEYHRIFNEWNDKEYLLSFFKANVRYLDNEIWGSLKNEPEASAASVIDDANVLEKYIKTICENSENSNKPDLDEYFHPLEGKYCYVWNMIPMKAYGRKRHTFIRIYAIKMATNIYLIVYGGLKLGKSIQDSPCLKDSVIKKIDIVMRYLKEQGIVDGDDL